MEERIRFAGGNISKKRTSVALYARVSTDGQTTENQLQELRKVSDRNGWQIIQEFVDHGISGAKGRDQRPAFDEMCKGVVRKEFDLVMAWSVDRLGRSLQHLVTFLDELHSKNVDLFLHRQGIDTTSPAGKMMFQMLGVFSEFERAMIKERINAGLARAKAQGKTLGRPKVSLQVENKIRKLRSTGKGIRKIASELRVGVSTVKRVVDELKVA
ncbi:MAG: recombinase family protein [Nitrospinae bacterium]|nr:recombinase family protein [Nitrospinota bacterium]